MKVVNRANYDFQIMFDAIEPWILLAVQVRPLSVESRGDLGAVRSHPLTLGKGRNYL